MEMTLVRLTHGLQDFLELQRACQQEAEANWNALAERGHVLENQFLALWERGASDKKDTQDPQIIMGAETGACNDIAVHAENGPVRQGAPNGMVQMKSANDNGEHDEIRNAQGTKARTFKDGLHRFPSVLSDTAEHLAASEAAEARDCSLFLSSDDDLEVASEQEKDAGPQEAKWRKFVHSAKFDALIGCIIVLNTVLMSVQIEYNGQVIKVIQIDQCATCDATNPSMEFSFEVCEHIFTIVFALELVIRLACDGRKLLTTIANIADALIVVISCVDAWILTPMNNKTLANVGILRLLRLAKLSKVFRVVRVMKAFKSLRVLVTAVVASVGALGWSMTLLFVLELIGAIFLAQVIQPYLEDDKFTVEQKERLWWKFGTWYNAMLTIFEITMAPGGFMQYRFLVDEVSALFGVFFVGYVCVVTFAVVRVITAMFLKATLAASDQDEEKNAKAKVEERKDYAKRLEHKVDADCSGGINVRELFRWLQTPRMQEWLLDAGLNPEGALRLFNALDPGTGEIAFSDYVTALERMMGQPHSSDIVVILAETRAIHNRLKALEQAACLNGSDPQNGAANSGLEGGYAEALADAEHADRHYSADGNVMAAGDPPAARLPDHDGRRAPPDFISEQFIRVLEQKTSAMMRCVIHEARRWAIAESGVHDKALLGQGRHEHVHKPSSPSRFHHTHGGTFMSGNTPGGTPTAGAHSHTAGGWLQDQFDKESPFLPAKISASSRSVLIL